MLLSVALLHPSFPSPLLHWVSEQLNRGGSTELPSWNYLSTGSTSGPSLSSCQRSRLGNNLDRASGFWFSCVIRWGGQGGFILKLFWVGLGGSLNPTCSHTCDRWAHLKELCGAQCCSILHCFCRQVLHIYPTAGSICFSMCPVLMWTLTMGKTAPHSCFCTPKWRGGSHSFPMPWSRVELSPMALFKWSTPPHAWLTAVQVWGIPELTHITLRIM